MPVLFNNDGSLDIRALTTFGVSVKALETAIGYFGTGFKYALATLLRNGQEVSVYAGDSVYKFSTVRTLIRGQAFELIVMSVNGRKPKEIGLTTQAGRNWNLYHAYRELYSNCMDEGGEVLIRQRAPSGVGVCVMVTGAAFEEVHRTRDQIILDKFSRELMYQDDDLEIYRGSSSQLWYRGIAAFPLPQASHFTYNFKCRMELTEDRTFSDHWTARAIIRDSILASNREDIIYPSVTGDKTFESRLDYQYSYAKPPQVFKEVVRKIRANPTAHVADSALTLFYKHTEEMSDIFKIVELTEEQRGYFDSALTKLKLAGLVPGIEKYQFIFVEALPRQSGEALKGKIIVNAATCCPNTNELISTILEEYVHLELKVQDCTREMQNALFDIIAQLLNK